VANSRSARKRIRVNETKRIRNRDVRSAVRTKVTKARRVVLSGETVSVEEELRAAVSALDKAGEKGILHRNNVNRRKSRLTAMAASIMRAAEGSEQAAEARAAAAGGQKGRSTRVGKAGAKSAAKSAPKASAKGAPKATTPKTAASAAKSVKATKPATKPKAG
jgi:small subunit ribosomal protein S20